MCKLMIKKKKYKINSYCYNIITIIIIRCITPLHVQTYLSALHQMGVVQRAVLGIIIIILYTTIVIIINGRVLLSVFYFLYIVFFFRPSPRPPSRPSVEVAALGPLRRWSKIRSPLSPPGAHPPPPILTCGPTTTTVVVVVV